MSTDLKSLENGIKSIKRCLIVNADDFGQSLGINKGVVHAHEHGIVTSASLMVRWFAAVEAAAYARDHPELSLGLHVDLCEWTFKNGTWIPLYQVVSLEDENSVREEVVQQLEAFHKLTGKEPTHIDSHQHIHREEPLRSILCNLSDELRIPLRQFNQEIKYFGGFYGQTETGCPYHEGITVNRLIRILTTWKEGKTELGCHPGIKDDPGLISMYLNERATEVESLCDQTIREILTRECITLTSFDTSLQNNLTASDSHELAIIIGTRQVC